MKEFSNKTRLKNIEQLKQDHFDLLIIGGGITGAGVARDAALRGYKVALVESNDFAGGTSCRSSKLIHGGIRYLENLEFHLVFEALNERAKLFKIAPHLVHPLRFMIPLYKSSRVGMFKMGLGMMLYDALALFQTPEMHERLSARSTLNRMDIVNPKELKGSYVYSDAYMDDDRLAIETLRSANEAGAVCVSYAKASQAVLNTENKKVDKIEVIDQISNEKFFVSAKHVVSTVGPWTDILGLNLLSDWKKILRPTKGVHLTFLKNRLPLSSAVVMAAEKSSRIVFAIPRHEMVIVGTTDTDFTGDPRDVKTTKEDIQYLLQITNDYFPGAKLTADDIVSSYVGVRPLVKDESDNEGKTSREHTILHDNRGFTFVAGGKYTTYRLMAEQIVNQVGRFFPKEFRAHLKRCETTKPLNIYTSEDAYHQALGLAQTEAEKLLCERHGEEAFLIKQQNPDCQSLWQYEAAHAIKNTMCLRLIDFMVRRVPLMLSAKDHGLSHLDEVVSIFEQQLGWSSDETKKQKSDYLDYINSELAWSKNFKGDIL